MARGSATFAEGLPPAELSAVGVGGFEPPTSATRFSPVSYVAPAREVGILFGALLGVRVLAEGDGRRRTIGAVAMVLGITALALG